MQVAQDREFHSVTAIGTPAAPGYVLVYRNHSAPGLVFRRLEAWGTVRSQRIQYDSNGRIVKEFQATSSVGPIVYDHKLACWDTPRNDHGFAACVFLPEEWEKAEDPRHPKDLLIECFARGDKYLNGYLSNSPPERVSVYLGCVLGRERTLECYPAAPENNLLIDDGGGLVVSCLTSEQKNELIHHLAVMFGDGK